MQKRRCIMVNDHLYQEIKKIKARLLIEQDIEVKNMGKVIEYIVYYYKNKEGSGGDKKIS
ncbi:MAG: hypothetical protein NZ870_05275 [bacterium]|nr:hypothetical protein [bacterium]